MDLLHYRRQFLLARQPIEELVNWYRLEVGQLWLYAHPDLEVTTVGDSNRRLILLGYLFDTHQYQATNFDILRRLFANAAGFDSLVQALKPFPGRYALLSQEGEQLNLIHDALALREVYYTQQENRVICASQPNFLARFAVPEIKYSSDPDVKNFVQRHLPNVRNGRLWPGDGTAYETIRHLLPNHYLDVCRLEARRYWPRSEIHKLDIDEAVSRSAAFLQGAMKAAAHRHPLMMAVTAGLDSRALLAASKDLSGSIYFFINQHDDLDERSADIRIPREIFNRIGVPFHIHQIPQAVPDDFKRIFFENACYAHEAQLPTICNVYFKQHSDKMNVLGVGEVGRTKFFDQPKRLKAYYLAYMLRYRKSAYAVKECEAWLSRSELVARKFGLNVMTLFWWEVLIGNWGSVGNSESDIAIEEFDPYDSHYLYETFLSVDPKFRTFKDNLLFDRLIEKMWPELLTVPVNPPECLKDWRDLALHKLGLELAFRKAKFSLCELCYHAWWKRR